MSTGQERYVDFVTAVAKEHISYKVGNLSDHEDQSCLAAREVGHFHIVNQTKRERILVDKVIEKVPNTP